MNHLLTILAFLALLLTSHSKPLDWTTTTERIVDYHSDITINKDTSLTVTETIQIFSTRKKINKGIFRDFPQVYKTESGTIRKRGLEIIEVTRDGSAEPFKLERLKEGTRIRIGDPRRNIDYGPHTYTITYKTTRQLGYFDEHDELYWNITGNGWAFPIDKASAIIQLPENAKILEQNAWTGSVYSTKQNAKFSKTEKGNLTVSTTKPLGTHQGITLKIKFEKGHLAYAKDQPNLIKFLRDNPIILGLALTLILLIALLHYGWITHGRDPKSGTIIPLYDAPEGLSAAAIRRIHNTRFDDTTFTTAILALAAKGALKISEKSWGQKLTRKKLKSNNTLTPDEKTVLSHLFPSRSSLDLIPLHSTTLKTARAFLRSNLDHLTEPEYHAHNTRFTALASIVFAIIFITSAMISQAYGPLIPILQMFSTIPMFISIQNYIKSPPKNTLLKHLHILSPIIFTGLWIAMTAVLAQKTSLIVTTLAVTCELIIIAYTYLNQAYTEHGRKILDQIKGLKLYLSVAEKDRLNLENPPERTPEHFEKFLPYALALDVEQQWAQQFHNILDKTTDHQENTPQSSYTPSFYQGSSFSSSLGAAAITTAISSTLGANIAAASTSPSQSSSPSSTSTGGFSGGGGGFSGGGGGGGGGGGW